MLGVVLHTCNLSTLEADEGRLWVQDHPGLCGNTAFKGKWGGDVTVLIISLINLSLFPLLWGRCVLCRNNYCMWWNAVWNINVKMLLLCRHAAVLVETIKKGIHDADAEARVEARK